MIKVYSKPCCVQCNATIRGLDAIGVAYEVVDITKDAEAYSYVRSLGYRQVPVVVAGENHWSGFQPHKINNLKN